MRDENFLPSLLGNSIINEIEEKGRDNDGSVERERSLPIARHIVSGWRSLPIAISTTYLDLYIILKQHKDKTQMIKYQIEPHNINLKELNTQFRASTENQDKQASRSHKNYIIVTKHETDKKKRNII